MIIGSKEIEYILNPESIERVVHQYTLQQMCMLNLFEPQNNYGEHTFEYASSKRTYETDLAEGILAEPVEITEGSSYPQVSFSGIQEEYGNMTRFGFEVEFSQEAAKKPSNYTFFRNCIADMGLTMARMINRFAFVELNASAGLVDPVELADGAWVRGNESVDDDIVAIKRAMENQPHYMNKYSPTLMYTSKTAYDTAEDLYKVINASGTFNGVSNGIRMSPAEEIKTGLMAIDLSCHPATWYFNLHEGDNRLNDPKVPRSSLINVHYFESDENEKYPHSFGYQMSVELGLAVDTEMAILTQSGV